MAKYPHYYVRPDGLHETIIRVNGKRKAFRGRSDKEVWEKVKAYDRSREAAEPTPVTFAQAADAWWAEIEPTLAHNSTKNYRPAMRRAVEAFGDRPAGEITAREIDLFIRDFSATRARKTVATQLQVIRQILRKAEVNGEIDHNPAGAVRLPKGLPQKRREAPDKDQVSKIKAGAALPCSSTTPAAAAVKLLDSPGPTSTASGWSSIFGGRCTMWGTRPTLKSQRPRGAIGPSLCWLRWMLLCQPACPGDSSSPERATLR